MKTKNSAYIRNVNNMVSHDKGRTIKIIFDGLVRIGYFIRRKVLNSADY